MNKDNLIDNHKLFIELNPWLKDINSNNLDIIECKEFYLYCFIRLLIENKVIQCNILIDYDKNRWYYNSKHYFNKIRWVSGNNEIYDFLIDYNGNRLFYCADKYDTWSDMEFDFKPGNGFKIDLKVNKNDLILIYNE